MQLIVVIGFAIAGFFTFYRLMNVRLLLKSFLEKHYDDVTVSWLLIAYEAVLGFVLGILFGWLFLS